MRCSPIIDATWLTKVNYLTDLNIILNYPENIIINLPISFRSDGIVYSALPYISSFTKSIHTFVVIHNYRETALQLQNKASRVIYLQLHMKFHFYSFQLSSFLQFMHAIYQEIKEQKTVLR